MATPCKKCGATKVESIYHGFFYKLARSYGYRLCVCSRCKRRRLIPLHRSSAAKPEAVSSESLEEIAAPPPEPQEHTHKAHDPTLKCPKCGKSDYRRSRRQWWEHLIGRPHMYRCRACRSRFPRIAEEPDD
jgi:hypothetical protein